MPIIAIDMDDVLADTTTKLLKVYNERFSHNITREQLRGRNFREVIEPDHFAVIRELLMHREFFADLEVIEGAQEAVARLASQHTLFVASAAMEFPSSFDAKFRWLTQHFPSITPANYVFCGDKSIIHADFLIDDQPRYLKSFRGKGLLFDAPHNTNEQGFPRVMSWSEIDGFLS